MHCVLAFRPLFVEKMSEVVFILNTKKSLLQKQNLYLIVFKNNVL